MGAGGRVRTDLRAVTICVRAATYFLSLSTADTSISIGWQNFSAQSSLFHEGTIRSKMPASTRNWNICRLCLSLLFVVKSLASKEVMIHDPSRSYDYTIHMQPHLFKRCDSTPEHMWRVQEQLVYKYRSTFNCERAATPCEVRTWLLHLDFVVLPLYFLFCSRQ
jgi:hypothetical protein